MSDAIEEKPLTFSQLVRFYREVMQPEIKEGTSSQLAQFYRDVMVSETKQSTFSQLVQFYRGVMRPEMEQMMDEKLETGLRPLRDEMHQGFDDLYKKFEKLEQEYQFANVQMKRLSQALE